ncbi:hypothetical protein, partial [Galactobacillus timonensis]|uniref:hypothetical protein n=1 Tax=Galactobacillus timonensis TaxID=2041840 RepID=UPI0023F21F36
PKQIIERIFKTGEPVSSFRGADQKNSEAYELIEEISEKGLDLSYQILFPECGRNSCSYTVTCGLWYCPCFPVATPFPY